MKVNCAFVEVDGPEGRRLAAECSVCGERFFDEIMAGPPWEVLASGITLFIDHANHVHHSTGGIIGGRRGIDQRSACA